MIRYFAGLLATINMCCLFSFIIFSAFITVGTLMGCEYNDLNEAMIFLKKSLCLFCTACNI